VTVFYRKRSRRFTPIMIGEALPVGTREPDGYLERYARQHAETKVSQTYVAVNGAAILGYYSLAMSAIRVD
jgi:hypothetical protein